MENKHIFLSILLISVLLLQVVAVSAISSSQAREEWLQAKQASIRTRQSYRTANLNYLKDKNNYNTQDSLEKGKVSLKAALDEVDAWLDWKKAEVDGSSEIPSDLEDAILEDIKKNHATILSLKGEVNNIQTRAQLGIAWVRMVGKYLELITDVSRDSGKIWVFLANKRVDDLETYEARLREIAKTMSTNTDVLRKLDEAQDEIRRARADIDDAEEDYNAVNIRATPLISFHEGNQHLRLARINMLNTHRELNQALGLMRSRQ